MVRLELDSAGLPGVNGSGKVECLSLNFHGFST